MWCSKNCRHPTTQALINDHDTFRGTDVAAPAADGAVGIIMTRWRPVAQFLACENRYQAVLVKDFCLACVTKGVSKTDKIFFIVS